MNADLTNQPPPPEEAARLPPTSEGTAAGAGLPVSEVPPASPPLAASEDGSRGHADPGELGRGANGQVVDGDEPTAAARASAGGDREAAPPPPDRVIGAVEALLLASGEALSAERLRDVLALPSALPVRDAIEVVKRRWAEAGLSVEVQDVAGGHRVVTRPEYADYVRRLWRRPTSDRLSPALLETLSVVAYRQPVARAEIERIRGVACGDALRHLLERKLIKVSGRSDQPGRPLLYATTARFLEVFGLAGLDDLPNAKDLARL